MKIINIFWNTFNDINYTTFIEVFGPKLESDRMCSIDFIEVFGPKLKSDHMCSIDFIEVFGPKLKSDHMCVNLQTFFFQLSQTYLVVWIL
jgi:hypothetical protein